MLEAVKRRRPRWIGHCQYQTYRNQCLQLSMTVEDPGDAAVPRCYVRNDSAHRTGSSQWCEMYDTDRFCTWDGAKERVIHAYRVRTDTCHRNDNDHSLHKVDTAQFYSDCTGKMEMKNFEVPPSAAVVEVHCDSDPADDVKQHRAIATSRKKHAALFDASVCHVECAAN